MAYVRVGLDCVGRLRKDHGMAGVAGLMTDGLETCIAIVIVGSAGCSIIHDSGLLTTESIIAEFAWVGDLQHFWVLYNPLPLFQYTTAAPGKARFQEIIGAHFEAIESLVGNVEGKTTAIAVPSGAAFLEYGRGGVRVFSRALAGSIYLEDPAQAIRTERARVNALFLTEGEQKSADLQYDSGHFTAAPDYYRSMTTMRGLLAKPGKLRYHAQTVPCMAHILMHAGVMDRAATIRPVSFMGEPVPSIAKLLVELDMPGCKITSESMQFALGKAVTLGNHEGVRYLIEFYGLDIDRPYNHKKTLLHMALSAGSESMVRLLLEYGARINIPDAAGVKATDLAREKGLSYLLGEPRAKGDVYSSTINTFQDHLRGRGLGLAEAKAYEAVLGID